MTRFDPMIAIEVEEAKKLIARAGPLTIQERTDLLVERMYIDPEQAHELVYLVEGWRHMSKKAAAG